MPIRSRRSMQPRQHARPIRSVTEFPYAGQRRRASRSGCCRRRRCRHRSTSNGDRSAVNAPTRPSGRRCSRPPVIEFRQTVRSHVGSLRRHAADGHQGLLGRRRSFRPGDERRRAVRDLRSRRRDLPLRPQDRHHDHDPGAGRRLHLRLADHQRDGHYIVYQGSDGAVFIYNNDPSDAAHYQHTTQLRGGHVARRSAATAASSSSSSGGTASASTISRATRWSRSRPPPSARPARCGNRRSAPTAIWSRSGVRMRRAPAAPAISLPMTVSTGVVTDDRQHRDRRRHQRRLDQRRRTLCRLSKRRRGRAFGDLSLRSDHRAGRLPHRECRGRQLQSGDQPGRPFHHLRQRRQADRRTTPIPSPTPMSSTSPIPPLRSSSWCRRSPMERRAMRRPTSARRSAPADCSSRSAAAPPISPAATAPAAIFSSSIPARVALRSSRKPQARRRP